MSSSSSLRPDGDLQDVGVAMMPHKGLFETPPYEGFSG
jgi:hypothetical protein